MLKYKCRIFLSTKVIKIFHSFFINLGDQAYYQALARELQGCQSVLDVGCGKNSPLAKVKKNFYSEGLDIHRPSVEKSKEAKIHDRYRVGDIRRIEKFYQPKTFDAVIALDLIEHLTKKDGLALLKKIEKTAKKKVILLTPNGFIKQDPYEDNLYQIHHSGWKAGEFKRLGYKVYGMRGLKFIRGEGATIKLKPWLFWGLVSSLSEFLVYFFPRLAYQLLAVKTFSTFSARQIRELPQGKLKYFNKIASVLRVLKRNKFKTGGSFLMSLFGLVFFNFKLSGSRFNNTRGKRRKLA